MTDPHVEYALIGHITADLIPTGRRAGGTVSYAARTAAAFGLRVGLLTSAAPDEPLLRALMAHTAWVGSSPAHQTTTFENVYTSDGRVQFVRGCAAPLSPVDVPAHLLNAPLVHLAPIAGELDPAAFAALFPRATILLTLQGLLRTWGEDGRVYFKRWFDRSAMERIDLVVLSEEDIRGAPGLEAELAAVARRVFITRAERGGTYYCAGERHDYSTPVVEAVSPTGAGDVFAAGLVCALHCLGDLEQAVRVAARLGATAVTRHLLDGAPTPDEVRAALLAARG